MEGLVIGENFDRIRGGCSQCEGQKRVDIVGVVGKQEKPGNFLKCRVLCLHSDCVVCFFPVVLGFVRNKEEAVVHDPFVVFFVGNLAVIVYVPEFK